MTTLEIILTGIIWIAYGVYVGYVCTQVRDMEHKPDIYIFCILFSPIVLLIKAILGIFLYYERK